LPDETTAQPPHVTATKVLVLERKLHVVSRACLLVYLGAISETC
jgi:hypothetical protein